MSGDDVMACVAALGRVASVDLDAPSDATQVAIAIRGLAEALAMLSDRRDVNLERGLVRAARREAELTAALSHDADPSLPARPPSATRSNGERSRSNVQIDTNGRLFGLETLRAAVVRFHGS